MFCLISILCKSYSRMSQVAGAKLGQIGVGSHIPNVNPAVQPTVSWSLMSLQASSAQKYQRRKVRGGKLSLPSKGRPAMY